jgi:RNA polymerase sigma factor (sigma-70 family)
MSPLAEIYEKHYELVRRVIRRFAHRLPEAEVEELTQDVFLKLRDSAVRFPEGVSIRSWIYSIAANTARSAGRRSWWRRRLWEKSGLSHAGVSNLVSDTISERSNPATH